MTELERRAMLGDKQAQEECTEKGIALPCQLCGFPADLVLFGTAVKHIREGCVLDHMVASLAEWNNRPKPPTERCKDCRRWMSYSGKSKYRDCQLSEDGLSCRFTPIVNEKARLIDAENYKEALRNLPDRATKEDAIALLDLMPTVDPENDGSDGCTIVTQSLNFSSADIESIISEIPAASVREDVRARWEYDEFGCYCTACHEYAVDVDGVPHKTEYCPECGARMIGVE